MFCTDFCSDLYSDSSAKKDLLRWCLRDAMVFKRYVFQSHPRFSTNLQKSMWHPNGNAGRKIHSATHQPLLLGFSLSLGSAARLPFLLGIPFRSFIFLRALPHPAFPLLPHFHLCGQVWKTGVQQRFGLVAETLPFTPARKLSLKAATWDSSKTKMKWKNEMPR